MERFAFIMSAETEALSITKSHRTAWRGNIWSLGKSYCCSGWAADAASTVTAGDTVSIYRNPKSSRYPSSTSDPHHSPRTSTEERPTARTRLPNYGIVWEIVEVLTLTITWDGVACSKLMWLQICYINDLPINQWTQCYWFNIDESAANNPGNYKILESLIDQLG